MSRPSLSTNTLSQNIQALRLNLVRYAKDFEEGRSREPALAPLPSAASVLEAISSSSPLPYRVRGEITAALVRLHQQTKSELWQSLLFISFSPMLSRVRFKLADLDDTDLDSMVMLAFLEVLNTRFIARSGSYMPIAIRRQTKRIVRREMEDRRADDYATHEAFDDTRDYPLARPCGDEDVGYVVAEVRRVLARIGDAESLTDMIIATRADGEPLRDYVERCYPTLSADDLEHTYQRLRRQRYQAEVRIGESPRFQRFADRARLKTRAA